MRSALEGASTPLTLHPGAYGRKYIGVRGRGATPPDYRTAHISFLGAHRGGPDPDPGFLRPFVRPSVRPFVRSEFGGRIWTYVSSGISTFWTILEPDFAFSVRKSDHLRNRTSVKIFPHTRTVSQVVTFPYSDRKSSLSNGPKVEIPLGT